MSDVYRTASPEPRVKAAKQAMTQELGRRWKRNSEWPDPRDHAAPDVEPEPTKLHPDQAEDVPWM